MTRRPSWLMVLMTVAVIVGACSSGGTATTAPTAATSAEASASGSTEPSASAGGSPASADCAGTGAQGGADLQIPDVEAGKFNVAMVLMAHTTTAAGARPTTRVCSTCARTCPTRMSRT